MIVIISGNIALEYCMHLAVDARGNPKYSLYFIFLLMGINSNQIRVTVKITAKMMETVNSIVDSLFFKKLKVTNLHTSTQYTFCKDNYTPSIRYTAIPKAIVTLSDSLVPSMEISASTSLSSRTSFIIPSTSLPITNAIFSFPFTLTSL